MVFNMNWEVIMWTCLTIAALMLVFVLIYYIGSARMIKKRRESIVKIYDNLTPGNEVLFSGGIKGKIVGVHDEFLDLEVSKGTILTVSKYSISDVLNIK